MNIFRRFPPLLFSLLLLLAGACADDDNVKVSRSSNCAVGSVVLGTLLRTYSYTLATGEDTTYNITVPGKNYPMTIDHLKGTIYNVDSLPYGTHIECVLFTSFSCDGPVTLVSEDGKDISFSSTDSVDLTTPRTFKVWATDGNGCRTYKMTLSKKQEDPRYYSWQELPSLPVTTGAAGGKLIHAEGGFRLFLQDGGTARLFEGDGDELLSWQEREVTAGEPFPAGQVTRFKNRFYAPANGGIITSDDGVEWHSVDNAPEGVTRLLGACEREMYLLCGEKLWSTKDGVSFSLETLDAPVDSLPAEELCLAAFRQRSNPNVENVALLGYRDGRASVWKKEVYPSSDGRPVWNHYPLTEENPRTLPLLSSLQVFPYGGNLYAFGLVDGSTQMWVSEDGARTWRRRTTYHALPENLPEAGILCAATDDKGRFYLVYPESGRVWRGRYNGIAE